jgi:hypothetical protein
LKTVLQANLMQCYRTSTGERWHIGRGIGRTSTAVAARGGRRRRRRSSGGGDAMTGRNNETTRGQRDER